MYILREQMNFYVLYWQMGMPRLTLANLAIQLAYFFVERRFLGPAARLFSLPRILIVYIFARQFYTQEHIKKRGQFEHRVNINELFDQDYDFLFENDAFKTLIKTVVEEHSHLVNPDFNVHVLSKGTVRHA